MGFFFFNFYSCWDRVGRLLIYLCVINWPLLFSWYLVVFTFCTFKSCLKWAWYTKNTTYIPYRNDIIWLWSFHLFFKCSILRRTLIPSFLMLPNSTVLTLYNTILRIARNLLETRENIKIESHSFYHIICDRFSWGSSKKKFFFLKKKSKMADFQNRRFSKSPILNFFCENIMYWSLGL